MVDQAVAVLAVVVRDFELWAGFARNLVSEDTRTNDGVARGSRNWRYRETGERQKHFRAGALDGRRVEGRSGERQIYRRDAKELR
jgi:hypothetical protein